MSYYFALPLLLLIALIEVSILPLFRVAGLQPDLMLVLLVVWLMVRGAREAFVLIPVGGFLLGLVESAPMGTALLALAPITIFHGVSGARLREGGLILTVAFTLLMTIVYHAVYLAVFALQGESGDLLAALLRVAVPACLLNVLVLLPAYAVVSAASQETYTGRPMSSNRSNG